MKRIYVLRHAKAGQTNKKILDDHERTLSSKGVEACPHIGGFLQEQNAEIDLILCSSSARTKQTVELVLLAFGKDIPIEYVPKLYLADSRDIFNEIHQLDYRTEPVSSIMIVGHNPGLQLFSSALAQDKNSRLQGDIRTHFPPGSLAVFDADVKKWEEIKEDSAKTAEFITPKELVS